jgi:hypothetical protein
MQPPSENPDKQNQMPVNPQSVPPAQTASQTKESPAADANPAASDVDALAGSVSDLSIQADKSLNSSSISHKEP